MTDAFIRLKSKLTLNFAWNNTAGGSASFAQSASSFGHVLGEDMRQRGGLMRQRAAFCKRIDAFQRQARTLLAIYALAENASSLPVFGGTDAYLRLSDGFIGQMTLMTEGLPFDRPSPLLRGACF